MKKAIVWFKTDLRLHDNETLFRAVEQGYSVIPVYCIDDAHYQTTKYNVKKTGYFRAQFVLESLVDLDKNLRKMGSGLLVVKGETHLEIAKLVKQFEVQKVFTKKEFSHEELLTQAKLEEKLRGLNCTFECFNTSTLLSLEQLPFALSQTPDVFTVFMKQVKKSFQVPKEFIIPEKIISPEIPDMQLPRLDDLGLEDVPLDSRAVMPFSGGETNALARVKHYLFDTKLIASYKSTRNGMIGDAYSSKFSAWLSLGCVSARSIYWQIKKFETEQVANESTYWLVFELLWRDYFYLMMVKYGKLFFMKDGIKKYGSYPHLHDETRFKSWKNGTTGNNFIDANMRELKYTGFMSNRGRQNVASYLCNDLKLDWRYGAAYFEEQLIDYDVCSNWCNWAYIAGVGNDPRGTRVFNIEKQANDYDKGFEYRRLWGEV